MVEQIFLSPQVKKSVIIRNKHCIYDLPHELPNDLRLKKLENNWIVSKLHILLPSAQCFYQNFVSTSKNSLKNRI